MTNTESCQGGLTRCWFWLSTCASKDASIYQGDAEESGAQELWLLHALRITKAVTILLNKELMILYTVAQVK
ncbi:hypothetical protein [Leisingera sp. M523]|uniref:hypothetical protein n=1 Tax=Leisingera sp. M523 TaxID=2867013 RepID=UPI0021A5A3A3|nr:hypothetical protein [Leisingera sp. M523]UWQ29040.1 hypothetical protein K3557_00055 [Leisingera sp. M523]